MDRKRVEYMDVAKGLGIILVVLGHVVSGGRYRMPGAESVYNFVYSFHMPLFFAISGFCIRDGKRLDAAQFKKMSKSYLIPYFFWTAVYLFLFQLIAVLRGSESVISLERYIFVHAISLCGVAPLWFLLALLISRTIILSMQPILKNRGGGIAFLSFLAALSILASFWYSSLPENLNLVVRNYVMGALRIFPTTFFVAAGYVFKGKIRQWENWKARKRFCVVAVLACLQIVMCALWNEQIDVQIFQLSNPWLYFPKALNGTIVIFLLSQAIHSKLLRFLGGKTKEIMILHHPPFHYTAILRFLLGKLFSPNAFGLMIITAVTIICCLGIDALMSGFRVWSFVMGNPPPERKSCAHTGAAR